MEMSLLVRALTIYYLFGVLIVTTVALPEQGKWQFVLSKDKFPVGVPKSLFKGSQIFIQISCSSQEPGKPIKVGWSLSQYACWQDFPRFGPNTNVVQSLNNQTQVPSIKPHDKDYNCTTNIILEEVKEDELIKHTSVSAVSPEKGEEEMTKKAQNKTLSVKHIHNPNQLAAAHPVYTINADGVYLLKLWIVSEYEFNATVEIEMQGRYGYLSAADWPLLPFYGAMCLVYVILGLAWLIVSFCQWRDLLRIQFWIGGVILLGMLEKATFYAEYQSINSTGVSVKGAMLLAELVSCGKRTLARMLVIIVSLGFGIVKPRLGPMLHRVVGTGLLYFVLAAIESYLRVMHPKNDPSNQILVASIPLAVLDSAICWWIFTSLVQTTRTLRLRRNVVKLSLYRHFTNTLIFAVISSVVFMLYSIKYHRFAICITDWKELWVDEAYWHLLFSVLLLVIMILWRPTNNNQRYAFTPLLDAPEDDEEEDEQFVNDAFGSRKDYKKCKSQITQDIYAASGKGVQEVPNKDCIVWHPAKNSRICRPSDHFAGGVKMRGYRSNSPKPKSTNNVEDDLKWVEENIPSSLADTALTTMDSDEEIMTTKFEVSKMQ